MKNMVNEFYKFARMPATKPSPNNLNKIISETLPLYREAHQKTIFTFAPSKKMPILNIDKNQIKRVCLNILDNAKKIRPDIFTKSGFMLGLGESREEIIELLSDIKHTRCDIITVGQYLRPSSDNLPVQKYYTPEEFKEIKLDAESFKFKAVSCGIFVRSSYKAEELLHIAEEKK